MFVQTEMSKGRLQNPTTGWPVVPSSSGRFPFLTVTTAQNRAEPPVNRRLGFEVVPKFRHGLMLEGKLELITRWAIPFFFVQKLEKIINWVGFGQS